MEKKEKKQKFPSISRIIPERLNPFLTFVAAVVTFFFVIVLLFGIVFNGVKIYRSYKSLNKLDEQRQNLKSQISFWQSVASKYPEYKDSYFRIAMLEYELGDSTKAKEFDRKALLLDPNYVDALTLQNVLEK